MRRSDSYLSSQTHIQFLYLTYKHTFALSANRKYTYLRSSPLFSWVVVSITSLGKRVEGNG